MPPQPDAAAQGNVERFERTLEQIRRETRLQAVPDVPWGQRALVDWGGYLTLSYLSFDDQIDKNHAFRGYDLVGYGRLNLDGVHELYLRGRATYRDFNPGDSFERQPDHLEGHFEEAWYRFDLQKYNAAYRGRVIDDNLVVQAGRQLYTWANGLTLSQYVDGVRGTIDYGPFTIELLAALTAEDLTVDFDSSRPGFERETRRAYYGAMVSTQLGAHRPFAYALVQRDQNNDETTAVGPIVTRFEYDSYYLGFGSNGSLTDRLVYGAEFVYEGGTTLSNSFDPRNFEPVVQQEDDIQAFAGEVRLDYLLSDPRRTRLGAGVLFASGDNDRTNSSNTFGGNLPGTRDHAFNSLGFVTDGLAFSPTFSNLLIVRGTVSTYPFPDVEALRELQCGVEAFVFNKFRQTAPIDEPTADERYLGWEPDLFVNWQVTDDVTLILRYGIFFPGEAIPSDEHRQFLYAGLTYAF